MAKEANFTLIVVGDNPSEMVKKYDKKIKVEPFPIYYFNKANDYHNIYIKYYETMAKNAEKFSEEEIKSFNEMVKYLKSIDDTEFFIELTDGFTIDEKTGDAMADINPDGKYDRIDQTGEYSVPLLTKDGKEVFSELKKNIDWEKIHLYNKPFYERIWDIIFNNLEPSGKIEETVKKAEDNWKPYLGYFKDKETYALFQTSFWGFAILDQNGWHELEDTMPQIDWVLNFYDTYIKNLPDDARLTIYECFIKI